ncbi:MAG: hypothetical protein K0R41_1427 [Geminicoccaceae bacterium]|nr:hypothetical protein [Geminicoccaceae bacterium]
MACHVATPRTIQGHGRAIVVYQPGLTGTQDDRRLGVEDLDAALEEGRRADIVVRRPFEVAAAGALEDQIVVGDRADVFRVADIAHPGIPARKFLANLLGAIGRGVVLDQQLEILVSLPKYGSDRFGYIVRAVENRKAN